MSAPRKPGRPRGTCGPVRRALVQGLAGVYSLASAPPERLDALSFVRQVWR